VGRKDQEKKWQIRIKRIIQEIAKKREVSRLAKQGIFSKMGRNGRTFSTLEEEKLKTETKGNCPEMEGTARNGGEGIFLHFDEPSLHIDH